MLQDPVLCEYRDFLANAYNKLPHPGMMFDQSPVMKVPVYVSLTLHKDRQGAGMGFGMFSGPGDEPKIIPIELQEILEKTKPNDPKTSHIVLVEGVPGSGKTTLSWHASQQWAAGQLFQDRSLLILIPLRNRRIQEARSLADLIPHPDKKHRKDVAQAISDQDGEGVCFWFEGWDEVPEVLHKSFVCSFIRQDSAECSLPHCSIVVTSRPNDAFTAHHPSRATVKINEFEKDQIHDYVAQNLQHNPDNAKSLAGKIEEDPHLQNFCSLPINLAIMVHLFYSFSMSLPKTMTELFRCLILNLMQRNLKTRWDLPARALRTFERLPQDAFTCLKNLCKMAYEGTVSTKTTFTEDELQQSDLPLNQSTLGLVKINPRIEWFGLEQEITFLHFMLQEFLAALHISMMDNEDEQAQCLWRLVEMGNQMTVASFYAGITKLENTKVKELILQVCNEQVSFDRVRERERYHLFLTLTNCIYETQSYLLCQKAFRMQLSHPTGESHELVHDTYMFSPPFQVDYYIAFAPLTSRDLRALGYFMANCCKEVTCRMRFIDCVMIGKIFDNFVNEVIACEVPHSRMSLTIQKLNLYDEPMDHEGVEGLSKLLWCTSVLSSLSVQPLHESPEHNISTKYLVEALSHNTSCTCFHLSFGILYVSQPLRNMIDYYLVLLLTFCRGIRELGIHFYFNESRPIYLFAAALAHNTNIVFLDLSGSLALTDERLLLIIRALKSNRTLRALYPDLRKEQLTFFMNHTDIIAGSALNILVTYCTIKDEHILAAKRIDRNRYIQHIEGHRKLDHPFKIFPETHIQVAKMFLVILLHESQHPE